MDYLWRKTTSRVTQSTSRQVNEQIRKQAEQGVQRLAGADKATLSRRLEELDYEWDVERAVETGAASAILLGLGLGTFVDRRWYAWSAAVAGFVLLHAVQGWAPIIPFLRRRGFRTEAEIEEERMALRILRGDFHPTQDAMQALAEARLSIGPSISGNGLQDRK